MLLRPGGRLRRLSANRPARRPGVHDQGSADHHALSGASAEEVAKEVTNPIESACQQLGQLRRVESESTRGMSVVSAIIQDRFHKDAIPQVWDELRRKIADVQPQLPPVGPRPSMVVDDFGDVYGIFLAITGEGYSQSELRRYTEFLRRELLLVPNVKKVELFGEQQEVVFLEISRQRLAQLGINEEQIYAKLQAKNVAADGGRVRVGDQHIAIDPHGGFQSADDMLDLVIGSDQSGRQLVLRDVATLVRGDQDPPRRLLRYDGKPAIGLGISTVQGGNVVTMGEGVRRKLAELKRNQPIGIEIGEINFQPEAVSAATGDFIFNLAKAVTIVFVVLLFAMGRKTGLIIGIVLFLTIMATFLVMYLKGDLLMERISLGALIIALCMLTDNAIIVIEGIKVGIEAGRDKLEVVREVVAQNQWPLFGATAIGIIAFAAIGLSEDSTGEYCNSLFWVILISLSLSWVSSITVTPLLSYLFFKPIADRAAGPTIRTAACCFAGIAACSTWRCASAGLVIVLSIVAFVAALYGFGKDPAELLPAGDAAAVHGRRLPARRLRTSAKPRRSPTTVGKFIQAQPGVTHVTSFIGGGGLRFLLVYSPERENRAFVQFLVDVDDPSKIDGLMATIQKHLDEEYPERQRGRQEVPARARRRRPHPGAVPRPRSGRPAPARRPGADDPRRRRRRRLRPQRLARARESDSPRPARAAGPPQRHHARRSGRGAGNQLRRARRRLLPRAGRQPAPESIRRKRGCCRSSPARRSPSAKTSATINSLQIWSPVAGRMIPLNQVTSGTEVVWEDPIVVRRDRFPTLTVHADPRTGLPSQLFNRVRAKIEAIELPAGYSLEWGGEYEDSRDARAALARPLPYVLAIMVFIVVCLFNSIRTTLLVWLIVPLAIIGVVGGPAAHRAAVRLHGPAWAC